MRALYLAAEPPAPESVIRERVELRQERQRALMQRSPPVRLTAVLGEAALTRVVGGADVLREQIRALRKLTDQMHIDIRYLPWKLGAHAAVHAGGFTIFDFADPDPAVVYIQAYTGARYLERPAELDQYRHILTSVYAQSIPISNDRTPRSHRQASNNR
jgi:hypothetical protein